MNMCDDNLVYFPSKLKLLEVEIYFFLGRNQMSPLSCENQRDSLCFLFTLLCNTVRPTYFVIRGDI